jgi:hypothetical protein
VSDDARPSALTFDGATILDRAPRVQALLARASESHLSLDGAFVVGGAVRDAILGRDAGPDIDIAVEGAGVAFAHLLASATGGEVESEHSFGTAKVLVPLGDPWGVVEVDIASCRTETYREGGALPTVQPGATRTVDQARRNGQSLEQLGAERWIVHRRVTHRRRCTRSPRWHRREGRRPGTWSARAARW